MTIESQLMRVAGKGFLTTEEIFQKTGVGIGSLMILFRERKIERTYGALPNRDGVKPVPGRRAGYLWRVFRDDLILGLPDGVGR